MPDNVLRPEEQPTAWVPLRLATQLYPSRVPGKRLSIRTLHRWIRSGKVRHRKSPDGIVLVFEPDLAALMIPEGGERPSSASPGEPIARRSELRADWEKHRDEVLAKYGFLPPREGREWERRKQELREQFGF